MIEVLGLTKIYASCAAVTDLSFHVAAGEVLGLVGPNGAGKTTTLRCMAGIIPPNCGEVRIHGHSIQTDPLQAKQETAFIPEEPRLFPYLTVMEHLQFTARIYGVSDYRPKATTLLKELELVGKEDVLPMELSRGMKQKLVIACGFLHSPKALLLDEPLTGLDPLGIRRIKKMILRQAEEGTSIIISSHLLHLVEEVCNKVLILREGRKVIHGTLEEILKCLPELQSDSNLEEIFFRVTASPEPGGDR